MRLQTAANALNGTLRGIDACLGWSRDPTSCSASVEDVSRWSVLAQLEHLALADQAILQFLVPPGPQAQPVESGSPNAIGYLVLTTGRIPRGKGRAPDFTVPQTLGRAEVEARFEALRLQYAGLRDTLPALTRSKARYPHPALGYFTPAQWLRFVDIHHRHHEAIIRDILEADRRTGGQAERR